MPSASDYILMRHGISSQHNGRNACARVVANTSYAQLFHSVEGAPALKAVSALEMHVDLAGAVRAESLEVAVRPKRGVT